MVDQLISNYLVFKVFHFFLLYSPSISMGLENLFMYCVEKFGDFCHNAGNFLVWTPGHTSVGHTAFWRLPTNPTCVKLSDDDFGILEIVICDEYTHQSGLILDLEFWIIEFWTKTFDCYQRWIKISSSFFF